MESSQAGLTIVKNRPKQISNSNELQTLWLRIEKHQKRNLNYAKKLKNTYDLFQAVALEKELEFANCIIMQVKHLAGFILRKSLSNTEREHLIQWIDEDLAYLQSHPFVDQVSVNQAITYVNEQHKGYLKEHPQEIDESEIHALRRQLDEEFNGLFDLNDDQLRELLMDPEKIVEHIAKLQDEFQSKNHQDSHDEDAIFEESFGGFDEGEHAWTNGSERLNNKLDKLFKSSQLNKMYKRVASKLHPDKGVDDEDRVQKHSQMQVLSEAKKNNDGYTILKLYLTYFNDTELDGDTLANLKPMLEAKIQKLNQEYRTLQYGDDMASLVWQNFKQRTIKKTEQAIEQHATKLHFDCDEMRQFIATHTTVKAIKSKLKSRMKLNNMFFIDELEKQLQNGGFYFE
ncbi:hypothetical protein [Pseudoalteromonas aurantia]|uniref:J domain-containing protein n=1 Tax=Pseudoalteromonas aurantia TaxID=43654 RepID=A0ABY2VS76_9GAMM|nr:hypothetical protein [Pseudoalteromonas aurantia]TMO56123.1 hypothetical protein CWC18_19765 [Pseudoalteromonas aurantia]TMO69597.1 hypothetical protein CWC20_20500 [Pseudoalteromonas aurantia]